MLVHFIGTKTETMGVSTCVCTHVDSETDVDHDGKEDHVLVFASDCLS